ncbi:MAG TPA: MBL fold metallo-hydrolase [Myxococcota bacterium]|nr:MBL fold metallo-hydrolase [Myxococcota bacterium]HQK52593.1 MBL fold metallo-hydrolase [Myxococcota bacterium]
MRLTFIGHACVLVEGAGGLRVLLDPYLPGAFGGRFGLEGWKQEVDIVASTHDHLDHFYLDPAFGRPAVVRGNEVIRGIPFAGVRLPHDAEEGARRGFVTAMRFAIDGVTLVHLGDAGRPPDPPETRALRPVDLLLVPVGGTFTVGPREALETARRLGPRVVVPMHYRLPEVDLPLLPLEDFLREAEAEGWPIVRGTRDPWEWPGALPSSEDPVVLVLPPVQSGATPS